MNDRSEGRLILVAEDDADDRMILCEALRNAQVSNPVKFVRDGVELMDYLSGAQSNGLDGMPALVLMDLNMPKMDGREALKQIRSDSTISGLPVVIFTTSTSTYDVCRAYRDGANTYVCKPSSFEDLVAVLSSLRSYWFDIARSPEFMACSHADGQ